MIQPLVEPVILKLAATANVSAVVAAVGIGGPDSDAIVTSSGVRLKRPIGETGAHLGWIPDKRVLASLTDAQKAERAAWRETEEGRTLASAEYEERE